MALLLQKTTLRGQSVSYWQIPQVKINWNHLIGVISLLGFTDEESRRSGEEPVETMVYEWTGNDFPFNDNDPVRPTAYAKLKTLSEWSGASDV